MSAPERIKLRQSIGGYFSNFSDDIGVEYIRADAILSDPRVKALAEALRWAVGREEFEADMEGRSENIWVRDARAALAAIKEASHAEDQ